MLLCNFTNANVSLSFTAVLYLSWIKSLMSSFFYGIWNWMGLKEPQRFVKSDLKTWHLHITSESLQLRPRNKKWIWCFTEALITQICVRKKCTLFRLIHFKYHSKSQKCQDSLLLNKFHRYMHKSILIAQLNSQEAHNVFDVDKQQFCFKFCSLPALGNL